MSGLVRTTRSPAPVEPAAGDKYTVLLLDEAQLDRFLRRTGGVPSLPPARRPIDVWPSRIVRPLWVAGALVAVLAGTAAAWLRASPGDAVSPAALDHPIVATGASFNVTVASFGRDADARALALRLGASGLPAYDWRVDGGRRQVLLGPYVSIDEAEEAQRAARASGFIATRLHVDERLRSSASRPADRAPRAVPTTTAGDPALVLVAAPGRVALALELADEPREVVGRRLSGDTYEVLIRQPSGWLREPAAARLWSAPPDVPLLRDVTLQEVDPGNSQNLRLRLAVPDTTGAAVRTVGRRVYVDLARVSSGLFEVQGVDTSVAATTPPRDAVARPTAAAGARPSPSRADAARSDAAVPAPAADARAGEPGDEDTLLGPIRTRFEEIQPFLRSAAAAPDPTVLDALRGTLTELERELRAAAPHPGSASRGLLASAIELAKQAVARDFAGDRAAQVREATAQFAAARPRAR